MLRKTKKKTTKSGIVPISQLKRKADTYYSKYIRCRDSSPINGEWIGTCITCNKPVNAFRGQGQAGHFQSRRFNATRYDDQNVHLQCFSCNVMKHGEQYRYSVALDSKYGRGTSELLERRSHQLHKLTSSELQGIILKSKHYLLSRGCNE